MGKARARAVVLGGGRFKGKHGMPAKGMLLVGGMKMAESALEACRKSSAVKEIVFVGPEGVELAGGERRVEPSVERRGAFESARRGVVALARDSSVLVLPADIPFLKAMHVGEIIERAGRSRADIYVPMVDAGAYAKSAFAERKRTAVEFREGQFIPTGIVVLSPRALENSRLVADASRIAGYMNDRKFVRAVYSLSRKVGFINLLALAKARLPRYVGRVIRPMSIAELEKTLKKETGLVVKVGFFKIPELGFDVDDAAQLAIAERIARKK